MVKSIAVLKINLKNTCSTSHMVTDTLLFPNSVKCFVIDAAGVTTMVDRARVRIHSLDRYPSHSKVSCEMKYILTPGIHLHLYLSIHSFIG
jgi:hypothetical protein